MNARVVRGAAVLAMVHIGGIADGGSGLLVAAAGLAVGAVTEILREAEERRGLPRRYP